MSEYQYLEFQAVDRPLTDRQMAELRALSTRAEITRTSFTNEYHWGDFKGNVVEVLAKYFDAHLYITNWGTHEFMVKLPSRLVGRDSLTPYLIDDGLSLVDKRDNLILEFRSEDEGGYWVDESEGAAWMGSLLTLRADILAGDHRALYLGWLGRLRGLYFEDGEGEEIVEPPVPPGLRRLTAPLRSLVEFLRVDEDLLEVAAEASDSAEQVGPSQEEFAAWLKAWPVPDKDRLLLRLLGEEAGLARLEVQKQFRESRSKPVTRRPGSVRRTAAQLLAARDEREERRRAEEARAAAKKRERQAREQAAKRAAYLDDLAAREDAVWREVDNLLATTLPKNYDRGVELLKDLKELADRAGRGETAASRIADLRSRFSRKPSLMQRFDRAGL